MKLILVEDDLHQAEWMIRRLKGELGSEVELIPTEQEFCLRLTDIERSPPDGFVIDVILLWAEPGSKIARPPQEVVEGGRAKAGFRCQKRLEDLSRTRDVPVVLYSWLDRAHFPDAIDRLPRSAVYLLKEADIRPLCSEIRRLIDLRKESV